MLNEMENHMKAFKNILKTTSLGVQFVYNQMLMF